MCECVSVHRALTFIWPFQSQIVLLEMSSTAGRSSVVLTLPAEMLMETNIVCATFDLRNEPA